MQLRVFVFCVALAATFIWALWPWFGGSYTYRQFVVGIISVLGENKSADYYALFTLFVLALALLWLLQRFIARIEEFPGTAASAGHLIGLALIVLALWLGAALGGNGTPPFPYGWMLTAGIVLVLVLWRWRTSMMIDARGFSDIGELVLASVLLSFFAGAGISLLVFHGSNHRVPASVAGSILLVSGVMLLNLIVVLFFFLRSPFRVTLQEYLQRWVVLVQYALPPLGLVLLPPPLGYRGVLEPYDWPWKLLVVLALYAAWTWFRLLQRLRRLPVEQPSAASLLEPMALAMIAVFVGSGHQPFELFSAPGYPTLFGDDFHLGEQILPWQQLVDFHRIPYVDFAPVHGLMPLLSGALNQLFFGGTLAYFNPSFGLLIAIANIATILLACRIAGVLVALAMCFLVVPFDRLLFFAPALLLLSDAALLARPQRWLATWFVVSVFMLGYNAALGSAFAAATSPIAVIILMQAWRTGYAARRNLLSFVAIVAALMLLTPYLRDIVAGFVAFVIENGGTNTVGHGIPWMRGLGLPGKPPNSVLASRVLFDLLRLSWIFVALFALQRTFSDWHTLRGERRDPAIVLACTTGLTLLLLIPWSMGRIDQALASRTGTVSFVALGALFPVLYVMKSRFPPFAARAMFALAMAIFAGMHGLHDRFSAANLAARSHPRVDAPRDLQRVNDRDLGSTRMGTLYISPQQAAQIVDFKQVLGRVLPPGQTYFDFTERQALYFYSNLPVPALYSAIFNLLNETQQRRVLRQLTSNPPAAALVAPALEGDGISASLRTFYLYRHFVRNYRPVGFGPYVFLVNRTSPAYPTDPNTGQEDDLLDRAFQHQDLKLLPASWGHSWRELESKADSVGDFVPAAGESDCRTPDDSVRRFQSVGRYELAPAARAKHADLIEIRLNPAARLPETLRVAYATADGRAHVVDMQAHGLTLVVPMSSYPSWLRAPTTPAIEVCEPIAGPSQKDLVSGVTGWVIPELMP